MIRNPDEEKIINEFRAREDKAFLYEGPKIGPSESDPYTVTGGEITRDFSLKEPPPAPAPEVAPITTPSIIDKPVYRPAGPIVGICSPPAAELTQAAEPVEKNLLDRFFDWLNKILSGP